MSNPKNPIITFQVNLTPDLIGLLHPARYQSDQDLAVNQMNQFTNLINTYIPGLLTGENVEIKHNGQIVAYGQRAKYLKDIYATDRPNQKAILTVVSEILASEDPSVNLG
jgi:hypothetical protein